MRTLSTYQTQLLLVASFILPVQTAEAARSTTTLSIKSPVSGSVVEATFRLNGRCNPRSGLVAISGDIKNPGNTECNRRGHFTYYPSVSNGSGSKSLLIKQGERTASASYQFTDPNQPTPDTTPPSIPNNLNGSALSYSEIQLSWAASTDNVGVIGYRIFQNGALLTATSQLSFTQIGLSPSTNYSYQVLAYDAAGNESAKSAILQITTPANPGDVSGSIEVYPGCESPATSFARKLYIDPLNGSDSGAGTAASPLRTLAAAVSAKKVLPGDHVIALPGDHGKVLSTKYNNPSLVNSSQWIWIDAQNGATFMGFDLRDMSRWVITKPEVTNTASTLVSISGSSNMIVTGANLYTTKDTSQWTATDWISTAASGMSSRSSTCVSFTKNKILNVRFGISVSTDATTFPQTQVNAIVADNEIQNYSGDGMRPIASNVTMRNNRIVDSYASSADGDLNHDDAIQGFALNGVVYDNVIIEGTYVQETTNANRAFNARVQGISIFDGLYTNLQVRKNVVLVSAYHGISMYGPKDAIIENNTVIGTNSAYKTWISVPASKTGVLPENVMVSNNITTHLSLSAPVTSVNNFVTPYSSLPTTFLKYDPPNSSYDLHLLNTSPLFGSGAGAY